MKEDEEEGNGECLEEQIKQQTNVPEATVSGYISDEDDIPQTAPKKEPAVLSKKATSSVFSLVADYGTDDDDDDNDNKNNNNKDNDDDGINRF